MSRKNNRSENNYILHVRFPFYAFCHRAENQRNNHKYRHCGKREIKTFDSAEASEACRSRQHKGLIFLPVSVSTERKPQEKHNKREFYSGENKSEKRLSELKIICILRQADKQRGYKSRRDKVQCVLQKVSYVSVVLKAVQAEIKRAYASAEHQNIRKQSKGKQKNSEPRYNIYTFYGGVNTGNQQQKRNYTRSYLRIIFFMEHICIRQQKELRGKNKIQRVEQSGNYA